MLAGWFFPRLAQGREKWVWREGGLCARRVETLADAGDGGASKSTARVAQACGCGEMGLKEKAALRAGSFKSGFPIQHQA